MAGDPIPFNELLKAIVDNRGRTCPTASTGRPLIATNCVRNDLLYPSYETERYVDDDTYRSWFRGHPLPGDLLFVTKGSPGRVCMVPDPVDFCIAQDMVAIRADERKVYPRFLLALLRSPTVQEQIDQLHVGTMIPHFKKGDFDRLRLQLPDKPAQEFVGDLYFQLSSKIELNRRMSKTLEAMARALFKSWFVDFDPVRAKAEGRDPDLPKPLADLFPSRLVDSELGEIPEGWEVGTLGAVLSQRVERCAPDDDTCSRPYVPIECIAGRSLLLAESRPGEEAQSSLTRFWKFDLLFGAMRPYFHKVTIAPFDGTTRTTVFVLRPQAATDFAYAAMRLHDPQTIEYATNHSTGSTIPYAVWQGSLEAMPVVLPPQRVRASFDHLARPFLEDIPSLFFRNHTLAALRDTLLPKLISGELRVNDVEKIKGRAAV